MLKGVRSTSLLWGIKGIAVRCTAEGPITTTYQSCTRPRGDLGSESYWIYLWDLQIILTNGVELDRVVRLLESPSSETWGIEMLQTRVTPENGVCWQLLDFKHSKEIFAIHLQTFIKWHFIIVSGWKFLKKFYHLFNPKQLQLVKSTLQRKLYTSWG